MPEQKNSLSLPAVILININIMLGTGIFINTTELAHRAGVLGALSYLIIGILMLPLVLSITELARLHPIGGFYTFSSKEISPLAGFISTWTYFTGKLASATVGIHTAVTLIQHIIPALSGINTIVADITIVLLFVFLNTRNMKTGSTIQTLFFVMKSLPILFVFLSGMFLINGANFTPPHHIWAGLASTLPLVLFAILGFEAACSLSNSIKDPEKNAPKAILISFSLAILISTFFQLIFYGALGDLFAKFHDFNQPFPALIGLLIPHKVYIQNILAGLLHLGIALSALGGSYGILFTNNWNLYTLAKNGHTYGASLLTQFNAHTIPWLCVIAEGLVCLFYLGITGAQQTILQQLGALGCVIAYTMSVASLLAAKKNKRAPNIAWWIPSLGFLNCSILIISCVHSLLYNGFSSLVMLILLLLFGIHMFYATKKQHSLPQF